MKQLILVQTLFLFGGFFLITHFLGISCGASFLFGSALMMMNLVLHLLLWTYLIQRKKLIAFAASVVVFKYAIFGIITYKILGLMWVSPLWFCAGVGSLLLSSVTVALMVAFAREDYVI